MHFSDQKPG